MQDLRKLKKKIHETKKRYRSKQTNMSFNLEKYFYEKDLKKSKNLEYEEGKPKEGVVTEGLKESNKSNSNKPIRAIH